MSPRIEPIKVSRSEPSRRRAGRDAGLWHPYLGAHMSIAGGFHHALESAARYRSGAVQFFTRNTNQWKTRPISEVDVRLFREANERLGPFEMAAHDSYLINLGSPDASLRNKSLRAFIEEIERCAFLGVPRLVFHPGAHMGAGEAAGLATIAQSVRAALSATAGLETVVLIENTAGQGTVLGYRLEHLEALLGQIQAPGRVGVCIDTCHLLAAGYDYRSAEGYAAVRAELKARIGLESIGWFHLNDSRTPAGSRVDRHAHIGKGHVGAASFRFFLTDPAFRKVPMVLETPKEGEADRRNLALLRRLSRIL